MGYAADTEHPQHNHDGDLWQQSYKLAKYIVLQFDHLYGAFKAFNSNTEIHKNVGAPWKMRDRWQV